MAVATAQQEQQKKETQKNVQSAQKAGPLATRVRDFPFFLSRLRDEFDHLLDRFAKACPRLWGDAEHGWRWGLEVEDQDDAVLVRAEAPGFEPGDFDVQVQDGRLTLRAARKTETKKDESREWSQRECYQSVTVPAGIEKDKVEARYHNGVLTITLPKTAEAKGRRVPVKNA
jgi:HSP20 family protein